MYPAVAGLQQVPLGQKVEQYVSLFVPAFSFCTLMRAALHLQSTVLYLQAVTSQPTPGRTPPFFDSFMSFLLAVDTGIFSICRPG